MSPRRPRHVGRLCKTCGRPFLAVRNDKGRLPTNCSPACRLAGLDRLIAHLTRSRAGLAERIQREAP